MDIFSDHVNVVAQNTRILPCDNCCFAGLQIGRFQSIYALWLMSSRGATILGQIHELARRLQVVATTWIVLANWLGVGFSAAERKECEGSCGVLVVG